MRRGGEITQEYTMTIGAKWNGIGVENGLWGRNEFRELLVVHRAR